MSEAKLKYFNDHFEVVVQGEYVICAQTKQKIAIDQLLYWSQEMQLAFSSAQSVKEYLRAKSQSSKN